jgi:hypothetical protein
MLVSNSSLEQLLNYTSLLLNISCRSASIKCLEVARKDGSYRPERPQLNLFIDAPYGQFKTTTFREVERHYESTILTDVTFPKLVGSYDVEQKRIVPSALWTYRNKTLIFDEFFFQSGIINALLQLTESGLYHRAIARSMITPTNEIDEDLYFKATVDGEISVKTRFNAVIGTMHDILRNPHVTYDALISRCVPIYYRLSNEDIKQVIAGQTLFKKIIFQNEPLGHIEWRDIEYFEGLLDSADVDSKLYARTLGDLCRIYNILGEHNENLYQFVIENKTWLLKIRDHSMKRHGKSLKGENEE